MCCVELRDREGRERDDDSGYMDLRCACRLAMSMIYSSSLGASSLTAALHCTPYSTPSDLKSLATHGLWAPGLA